MMPFWYGRRKALQMQTDTQLARTVSLRITFGKNKQGTWPGTQSIISGAVYEIQDTPGEYKMMTDHRISTIHNKGNKMGKNMGECNHECDHVNLKQRRRGGEIGYRVQCVQLNLKSS